MAICSEYYSDKGLVIMREINLVIAIVLCLQVGYKVPDSRIINYELDIREDNSYMMLALK
jgi:hypothetical protein